MRIMSSSYGQILKITIFGESHSEAMGLTIDGLPSGFKIDEKKIKEALKRRHGNNAFSTPRNEDDELKFISGFFEGKTTGTPLTFIMYNKDIDSSSYEKGVIRPSHSDLTSYLKYDGNNDYRGGGMTSGRLTACLVVLGSICEQILAKENIKVLTHISSLHGLNDRNFDLTNISGETSLLNDSLPVLDQKAKEDMINEILKAKGNKDSVGGILESMIVGVPIGLGEPYFDSLESTISHLLFSVGGVKGVLFGDGLDFASKYGSEINDQLRFENNKLKFLSNHSGGINGGISNGQAIIVKTIVKPTPSISKKQQSVNLESKTNIDLEIKGRHDPCIVHRIAEVINGLLYYAILDALMFYKARKLW